MLFLNAGCVITIGLLGVTSAYPQRQTHFVHPGQSIQNAIDHAQPYDRIVVKKGTYSEQLTITKDGICLEGYDAVLNPPTLVKHNTCSNLSGFLPPNDPKGVITQAGICISARKVNLAPFVSEHRKLASPIADKDRVKDVSVTGFSISGFTGQNIAIVGGKDTTAEYNTLTDGVFYGALTVGSINSQILNNKVTSTPPSPSANYLRFIGICMDDVKTVTVAHNSISQYVIGLCVQTNGANIFDNYVSDVCIGAHVDPGIKGAQLTSNTFKHTNPACQDQTVNYLGAIFGIAIFGADGTILKDNKISGISAGKATFLAEPAAGIVVRDDYPPPFGTASVASGNEVQNNYAHGNDVDMTSEATGTGNVFTNNNCHKSNVAGICKN